MLSPLMSRLGLGCGRLRGGFEEPNSRSLVETALKCGISYFDTAPSYGESETILGRSLKGVRNQVEISTKVGLYPVRPRPLQRAKGALRSAARAVVPAAFIHKLKRPRRRGESRRAATRGYGEFDPAVIGHSVERSLDALGTDHVDCLMLHEPRLSDPVPEVAERLASLVHQGLTVRLGVGTSFQLGDLPQFGSVAQFALGLQALDAPDSRTLIGHGVLREFEPPLFESCARQAGIIEALPAASRCFSDPQGGSALLLNAVVFGTRIERILVSTNSPKRLLDLSAAAAAIFEECSTCQDPSLARRFRDCLNLYLERRSAAA